MTDLTAAPSSVFELVCFGLAAGLATLLGGALAIRFRTFEDHLVRFTSGTVIGVALFDLLPEAAALREPAGDLRLVMALVAIGFAVYYFMDRTISAAMDALRGGRGHFGAAMLTVHSFADGFAIGLAFHVAPEAGLVVLLGVLAHDVADGMNTFVLATSGGAQRRTAIWWVAADALAPLAGIAASMQIAISPAHLGTALGIFAGFFLYVGASELLPRGRAEGPIAWSILAMPAGLGAIYAVIQFGH